MTDTKVHIPLSEFVGVDMDAASGVLLCDVKDFPRFLDSLEGYVRTMRSDLAPLVDDPLAELREPVDTGRRRGGG